MAHWRWADPRNNPDQHRRWLEAKAAAAAAEAAERTAAEAAALAEAAVELKATLAGLHALELKSFPFDPTAATEAAGDVGLFSGLAAVFGVRDELGDQLEPGCFASTIAHRKGKFPVLWQHDPQSVLGFATVKETSSGLFVSGTLALQVQRAREVHSLMKQAMLQGFPFGLSFGFNTLKAEHRGGVRHVKEVRLFEISPTVFPAQSLAGVTSVKTRDF